MHRASTRPFFNEAGELTHWLGTLVDIHEQLLSSLDHERVLDVLPTVVWAASPTGEIEQMNAEWTTITGLPSEAARGTGLFDHIHPDDRGRAMTAWRGSIETGEPCDIELRFRTRTTYRWHVVRARAVFDETGAVERWHGVAIDINDRHRLDTALVESERRFRELADALPHLVWTTSADGKLDFLNRHFTEVTGIGRRTAIATDWVDIIHPDDRDVSQRQLHAMLARGEAGEREHRIRTHDGSYRWMLAHTMPIRDATSAITGWLSTATDIEAQKRSQRSLRFLARLSGLLGESLALDLTLRGLTATASEEFAARCTVGLIRPDGVVAVNTVAQDGDVIANDRVGFIPLPRAQSPITRVIESQAPLLIDTTIDIDHVNRGVSAKYFADLGMRYVLAVPLSTGKAIIGGICFARRPAEGPFDSDDFVLARSVAERATTAIDNARAHEALERTERATRIYGRFSTELAHSIETAATLKRLAELAIEEIGETSSVGLLQPDGQIAVHANAMRSNSRVDVDAVRFLRLLPKTSAMARVAASGESLLQAYLTEDDLRAAAGDDTRLDAIVRAVAPKSALVVPLISHGKCLGSMTFCRVTPDAPYDERDLALAQQLGERAAIAISNAQQYELISNIATVLQTASMPATLPQVPSCRFSAIYRPAKREAMIGGDWYDVFTLGDGRVGITIGDVLGSGLDAAVTMAKLRQAMQSCAVLEPDPITMLDAADATLRLHDANGLATAIAAIYDPRARRLRFASAGHPLPVLRSGKNVGTFDAVTMPPLGVRDPAVGEVCTTWLNVGDTIVFYTDGLVESTHDIIEGTARVFETLSKEAPLGTPQDAHIIANAVLPDGARDDVAIVTMTVV